MLPPVSANATDFAVALLIHYSFDLSGYSGYTARELVERWLNDYTADWINLAVIEALYRGRYKAISVEQILAAWQRRGIAIYHFNYEFECLICGSNIPPKPRRNPDTQAKFSPIVPKPTGSAKDGHDNSEVVKAEAGASDQQRVQLVDTDTKFPPSTDKSDAQLPQSKNHQISSDRQKARSPSSASHSPIQQFNPAKTNTTDFYSKLKAIVQSDRHALVEGEARE